MATLGGVRRWLAVLVALVVAAAAVLVALDLSGRLPGGLAADQAPTPTPTPTLDPPRAPAAAVLPAEPTTTPSTSTAAPTTLPAAALDRVLAAPALGRAAGATVVDVATGHVLFDRDQGTARTPASIAKLATAATVLRAVGPQHRLTTRVVAGSAPGQVVLVGAGDPTLTAQVRRGAVPRPASLAALADATAAALKSRTPAAGRVTVAVDGSLFAGPAVSPDWPASYVGAGVVAPVSALSVDEGRVRPDSDVRERDPAIAAGQDLARMLARRGLDVAPAVVRATAPAGAETLAAVSSPTVAELVQQALQNSDNDLAEALLRVAAVAHGQPATFEGGTATVLATLTELGVPTDGVVLLDGSGLARGSRVPPVTLATLLRAAADGSHPELAALVEGLPVAAFSGTLATRFDDPGADGTARGAGVVRAKTGTLTGVSSLAGVTAVAGRPVVFVAMSDRVPVGATVEARDALDRFASTLAAR